MSIRVKLFFHFPSFLFLFCSCVVKMKKLGSGVLRLMNISSIMEIGQNWKSVNNLPQTFLSLKKCNFWDFCFVCLAFIGCSTGSNDTIWQWWNEWISKEQKYNVSDIHWRRGANGKPIPMMRWLKNSVDLHERTHRGVFYHCTHHYIYWEAKLRPQSVDISQSSSCVQKCFQQQERSLSRFFTWCVWWQKTK